MPNISILDKVFLAAAKEVMGSSVGNNEFMVEHLAVVCNDELKSRLGRETKKIAKDAYAEETAHPFSLPGCRWRYDSPRKINEQVDCLCKLFPGLRPPKKEILEEQRYMPSDAGGRYAIPNWAKLPQIGDNYPLAVNVILRKLGERGDFFWDEGRTLYKTDELIRRLSQRRQSKIGFDHLSTLQGDPDILILPAQFSKGYCGYSPRRACVMMTETCEFPLGIFAVGSMLLANPDLEETRYRLDVSCAGDIINLNGDGATCPRFSTGEGARQIHLGVVAFSNVNCSGHIASGFAPPRP